MDGIYNLTTALPFIVFTAGAVLLLFIDLFKFPVDPSKNPAMKLMMSLSVLALTFMYTLPFTSAVSSTDGFLIGDPLAFVFCLIILAGTALTLLLNYENLAGQRVKDRFDIDLLILLASIGGMAMVSASNLAFIFVAFELLSICVYVLTGLAREEKASSEGALKYFILGAFSSGFLVYGMALVYASVGSLELFEIRNALDHDNVMLLLGLGLIIFGFAFKVSLVPFHFWTPDVYQGAPVSIATYMAVVVKASAFGCFLRIMTSGFGIISDKWVGLMWVLCVVTMTVGNLLALRQRSIKRMLAYSSIAHAGYAIMGFIVPNGSVATTFYLLVYALMTIASFGVVLLVTRGSEYQYANDDISSFSRLGWTYPALGLVMTIALLSLGGMPPLGGFIGKLYLFQAGLEGNFVGLVIIAALNSVVSLYYYLRVIVVMYFSDATESAERSIPEVPFPSKLTLAIASAGIIYFGLCSDGALTWLGQHINL